jgi:putative toxin-antitoxin system antitoxin component (TIGR02293 family)
MLLLQQYDYIVWTNDFIERQTMHAQREKITSLTALIQEIKTGLPVRAFEDLSRQIGVPQSRLTKIVNIEPRTLTRRKIEGRFKPTESERVLRLVQLYKRAVEVLGDPETAKTWFSSPVKGLGYKTPLDFADTEPGAHEVENLLGRIEDGVFF